MLVETPKAGVRPPMEKAENPAEIVEEPPVMSATRRKLLTYAILGTIFEMSSQAEEPVKPKVEHEV